MNPKKPSLSQSVISLLLFFGVSVLVAGCGGGGGGGKSNTQNNTGGSQCPGGSSMTDLSQVRFVDAAATGAGNGTSWVDAFTTIQAALDNANASAIPEVWVAGGTYRGPSANAVVVNMTLGVALFGGFDGTETAGSERSCTLTPTIISGDFNGDDTPGDLATNKTDNSSTVVWGISGAVIDGFIIEGGSNTTANPGGGMITSGAEVHRLRNMVFRDNFAGSGGALALMSFTYVSNSVFFNNAATNGSGGAIYTAGSDLLMTNATLDGNSASANGGGVYNNTNAIMTNVTFVNNTSANGAGAGSGVWNDGGSAHVLNSISFGNSVAGGAVFAGISSITNSCTAGDYSAQSNTNVGNITDPFVMGANGEYFLDQAGPCVDIGSDNNGDDGMVGFTTVVLKDWREMTTDIDGALDATPIDAGRHY